MRGGSWGGIVVKREVGEGCGEGRVGGDKEVGEGWGCVVWEG